MTLLKVQYLSDLHLEMVDALPGWRDVAADIIVIAGDIGRPMHVAKISRWAGDTCPIVIVLGNHDYWIKGCSLTDCLEKFQMAVARVNLRRKHEMFLIQDRTVKFNIRGHDCRVLGGTLWTDFEFYKQHLHCAGLPKSHVLDRVVQLFPEEYANAGNGKLSPQDLIDRHEVTKSHIRRELQAPASDPTIIVTHHLPSARSIKASYAGQILNAAFASHMDDLVDASNALWVHGHVHHSLSYPTQAGGMVVTNPVGLMMRDHLPINDSYDAGLYAEYSPDSPTTSWVVRSASG